jgi:hypothetical protein
VVRRWLVCAAALLLGITLVQSQSAVDVAIDAAANRHAIDPRIYGVAHADTATLADLRIPLHRWGGNVSTRHNWQANASNRGGDWYYESIADGPATPGLNADNFVNDSKNNGAQAIITIPMAGWVAKVGPTRNSLASFSVAKYGPQQSVDPWFPDAGNGVRTTGANITGNDPNDANTPSDPAFQRGWVQHLVSRWGTSANGGVRYYALDNEPGIWHSTHRDIHPNGASMDEVFNSSVAYATQIKSVDSGALVLGPEEWGWSGYLYSGRDLQYGAANGWSNLPDRTAHGNQDFVAWYLAQFRQRDTTAGQRLLDVFTLHYYPQGGEFGNDTSTAMQQRRNRSTRSLWDPTYVDETWIATQVQLIPRMKSWVATHYPGTRLGLTEYNWGAEGHINGATAQADVLGIFGREGLDMATFWTYPAASTPTYKAIKMYRNYDGQGSGFGDTSVSAVAPNPDSLSVFAAQRGTGALTIMAINKDLSVSPSVNLRISNFTAGGAVQVWRLSSSNTITRLGDTSVSSGVITATLPTQTITLFVVPGQSGSTPTAPAAPTNVRIISSTSGTAASVAVSSGSPQTTTLNTAFGSPLRAVVRNSAGAGISGISVAFAAPASGPSATFAGGGTGASAVTDASGVATSPSLTANGTAGSYNVTATVGGVSTPATFALTNTNSSSSGATGTWTNVTPGNVSMGSMSCGNYGTITVVADPARPSNLYTHFDCQGIWRSTDYGQTWSGPINTGSGGAGANGAGGIAIARGPAGQPPILYSAGIRGSGMGFWRSTDGGVSWTNHIVGPGGSRQDFYPPVVDPYNGDHLLMAGHEMNLLVQSFDGGRTWSSIPMAGGMNQNGGTAYLYFINTGNASTTAGTWLYSAQTTGGGIGTWRTANGGGSWVKVDNNEHPHGTAQYYQPDTSGVVYMAGAYSARGWGVLRSTDYGQTWTHVGATANEAVVWGTPNRVYAMYSWACGNCTVATSAQSAAQPGTGGWTAMPTPAGMTAGAAQAVVVFDGSKYVTVTANWLAGLWRYVE